MRTRMGLLWWVALGCAPTQEEPAPTDTPDTVVVDTEPVADTDCPAGFSGIDCSVCSWDSAGEACVPGGDVEIYDLDTLGNLGLDELAWVELSRRTERGVLILEGTWSGGPMVAVSAEGELEEIELLERAAIYLPPGEPGAGPAKGFVSGVHFAEDVDDPVGIDIARSFGIPVLLHGQERENWTGLGFDNRGAWTKASSPVMHERNPCHMVDPTTGNFRYHSARTHLRATTLLQRVVESFGGEVETVALRGYSKEGSAVWLASIYDPRIEVASPGGTKLPSARLAQPAWWESYGCGEDAFGERAQSTWTNHTWVTQTPAGAETMGRVDALYNQHRLKPRLYIMEGDHGAFDDHDGMAGMPPAAETPFLDALQSRPWRYFRKWEPFGGAGDGGDETSRRVLPLITAELLVEGDGSESRLYPKVAEASATLNGDILQVQATVAEGPPEAVRLWWSWSADRIWADVGQQAWVEVAMEPQGAAWVSPEVTVPAGGVVGWYVSAENEAVVGDVRFPRRDASPMRFARTTPALSCDLEPIQWCP